MAAVNFPPHFSSTLQTKNKKPEKMLASFGGAAMTFPHARTA